MNRCFRGWSRVAPALVAALVVGLLPTAAAAVTLGFRNDTDSPVIVQGISIVNQVIRRGPPHVLQPAQSALDVIVTPGNKLIIIADAKQPTRILYRDTIQCGAMDLFFSIQPDPPPKGQDDVTAKPKAQKPTPAKVKLVPMKPPSTVPGTPGPRR